MTDSTGRIRVRGYTTSGEIGCDVTLEHGWSPHRVLRVRGWRPVQLRGYRFADSGEVTLEYDVLPATVHGRALPAFRSSHDDAAAPTSSVAPRLMQPIPTPRTLERSRMARSGLTGHTARPTSRSASRHQRLGAYAVVSGPDGVLLTQLSSRTSRAGLWVLPGGGVDPEEDPAAGVRREVWEESGQSIELGPLVEVSTSHRVGDFHGEMEDFHAVRMIFAARCDSPTPLVVHDVDGSTGRAEWFPAADVIDVTAARVAGGVAPWTVDAVRKTVHP